MTAGAGERSTTIGTKQPAVLFDAATAITLYIVVLLGIPSDRRIMALGGAGAPAALLAIVGLLWWGWYKLQGPGSSNRGFRPVSAAALFLVAAMLASYVASSSMALPAADRSVADLGLLRLASMIGILLIAGDGIRRADRFHILMRRISFAGGIYASLGLFQFFTGITLVDSWSFPGLSTDTTISIGERGGFVRALSTAIHPLESAVVLVMILPIALTIAVHDRKLSPVWRWFPTVAILLLSVLSVTRSALLGVVVVFLVLFPTWPRTVRQWMGIGLGFGSIAVYVGVPGMAGTIIGMFTSEDSSITSRTDSYSTALDFVDVSPLFGRGFGTFLPAYRILDNQFLLQTVETGFVGLFALVALIVAACWCAARARKWQDPLMRGLGWSLLAAMLAGGLLLAFFDAFSFPQACGMFFLVVGLCGAYGSMNPDEISDRNATEEGPETAPAQGQGPEPVDEPEQGRDNDEAVTADVDSESGVASISQDTDTNPSEVLR